MVATLARTADSRTTSSGQVNPPSKMPGRDAATSAAVHESSGAQKPLARQSIRSAGMSSTTAS